MSIHTAFQRSKPTLGATILKECSEWEEGLDEGYDSGVGACQDSDMDIDDTQSQVLGDGETQREFLD